MWLPLVLDRSFYLERAPVHTSVPSPGPVPEPCSLSSTGTPSDKGHYYHSYDGEQCEVKVRIAYEAFGGARRYRINEGQQSDAQ